MRRSKSVALVSMLTIAWAAACPRAWASTESSPKPCPAPCASARLHLSVPCGSLAEICVREKGPCQSKPGKWMHAQQRDLYLEIVNLKRGTVYELTVRANCYKATPDGKRVLHEAEKSLEVIAGGLFYLAIWPDELKARSDEVKEPAPMILLLTKPVEYPRRPVCTSEKEKKAVEPATAEGAKPKEAVRFKREAALRASVKTVNTAEGESEQIEVTVTFEKGLDLTPEELTLVHTKRMQPALVPDQRKADVALVLALKDAQGAVLDEISVANRAGDPQSREVTFEYKADKQEGEGRLDFKPGDAGMQGWVTLTLQRALAQLKDPAKIKQITSVEINGEVLFRGAHHPVRIAEPLSIRLEHVEPD